MKTHCGRAQPYSDKHSQQRYLRGLVVKFSKKTDDGVEEDSFQVVERSKRDGNSVLGETRGGQCGCDIVRPRKQEGRRSNWGKPGKCVRKALSGKGQSI